MTPRSIQGRVFFPNLFGGIAKTANSLNPIRSVKKKFKVNLTAVDSESAVVIVTSDNEKIEVKDDQLPNTPKTSKCMSLPNELFSEIFILCLPYIATSPKYLQHWSPSIDYFAINLYGIRKSLSQVCRRWRGVVHSTPGMWTSLVLGRSLKWDEEVLKVWAGSKSRVTKLTKIVRGHVHRLRSFIVDHIYYDELQGLFPLAAEPITVLPALQIFVVRQYTSGFPAFADGNLLMGHVYTPCIQYMELAEAIMMNSFLTISLPYLQNLNLASSKFYVLVSTYYQFLATCPNLVSLRFTRSSVMSPSDFESEPPEHRLILPMVENFEFMQDHTPDTLFLVRSLQLPELKTLKFGQFERTRRNPGFIHEFFSQLIVESAETLQDLILLQGSILPEDTFYPPLIKTMRNLKTLVFDNVFLRNSVIEALMPDSEEAQDMWPCPKLRALTIDQLDIDGDRLVELLKIRTLSDKVLKARSKARKEAEKDQDTVTEEKPVPEQPSTMYQECADEEKSEKGQESTKGQEPLQEREPANQDGITIEHQSPGGREPPSKSEEVHANDSESVTKQEISEEEPPKELNEVSLAEETPAKDDALISDQVSISSSSIRTSIFPFEYDDGYFASVMINRNEETPHIFALRTSPTHVPSQIMEVIRHQPVISRLTGQQKTPSSPSQKDYSAAFASLQSSLGLSGTTPCLPPRQSKKTKRPPSSTKMNKVAPISSTTSPRKDYAAAFASLQSSCGFGGSVPNYTAGLARSK
ncbi:hypothetical protein BU17DRAFT_79556 [Hysterangium stoloniferum]|nr:hypothetical protein BU17DRAFT_79556 [Hysterangium stoloniferum]